MNKNSLEQSIAKSMDCPDIEIITYLPYILQDFWEIGSSAQKMKKIIEQYYEKEDYKTLQVADLGCGKGAVSIKLASDLRCYCLGIDANREFIYDAQVKAKELNIDLLCSFEINDIRQRIKELSKFDIIILASIGPVFGNHYETLLALSPILSERGIIILDDGYIEDSSSYIHPSITKRNALIKQIQDAGMKLVNEVFDDDTEKIENDYDKEFTVLEKRCRELIVKYPEKAALFEGYINKQMEEYNVLKNKVICSTMVIKKAR